MTVDNLATVFGPTVIGYSTAEPMMNQILTETKTQQLVSELTMEEVEEVLTVAGQWQPGLPHRSLYDLHAHFWCFIDALLT